MNEAACKACVAQKEGSRGQWALQTSFRKVERAVARLKEFRNIHPSIHSSEVATRTSDLSRRSLERTLDRKGHRDAGIWELWKRGTGSFLWAPALPTAGRGRLEPTGHDGKKGPSPATPDPCPTTADRIPRRTPEREG